VHRHAGPAGPGAGINTREVAKRGGEQELEGAEASSARCDVGKVVAPKNPNS